MGNFARLAAQRQQERENRSTSAMEGQPPSTAQCWQLNRGLTSWYNTTLPELIGQPGVNPPACVKFLYEAGVDKLAASRTISAMDVARDYHIEDVIGWLGLASPAFQATSTTTSTAASKPTAQAAQAAQAPAQAAGLAKDLRRKALNAIDEAEDDGDITVAEAETLRTSVRQAFVEFKALDGVIAEAKGRQEALLGFINAVADDATTAEPPKAQAQEAVKAS